MKAPALIRLIVRVLRLPSTEDSGAEDAIIGVLELVTVVVDGMNSVWIDEIFLKFECT